MLLYAECDLELSQYVVTSFFGQSLPTKKIMKIRFLGNVSKKGKVCENRLKLGPLKFRISFLYLKLLLPVVRPYPHKIFHRDLELLQI